MLALTSCANRGGKGADVSVSGDSPAKTAASSSRNASIGVIYANGTGLYTETDEGKMKWTAEYRVPAAVKPGRMLNQGNRDCLIRAHFHSNRRFPPVAFAFKNRDVIDRKIFDKVQFVHNLKRLCHYSRRNIPI